jgi:hypothetical protein
MRVPEHVTSAWMDSLDDGDLLTAESRLHTAFSTLETEQRSLRGQSYQLLRGPAELLAAWANWSRVSTEIRERRLHARRRRSAVRVRGAD